MTDDDLNRRGIQSIEIGLRIIDALREMGSAQTLKALSAASGLPASNCHRYLVSFIRSGFLVQDEYTGRYDFGPRLLHAGLAALSRVDAVAVATHALSEVVDKTGHTGLLAMWSDNGPVIIRWMAGRIAVRTSLTVGSTFPLLTSATGRVFLAFLPSRQTAALAAREMMAGAGNPEALANVVRAVGVGQVAGDHIPGLSAISVPALDANGEVVAALTLVGARDGIAPGAVDVLRAEAHKASARLGWSGHLNAKTA